jgi:uncharacterized RDD family membrane protein YckC
MVARDRQAGGRQVAGDQGLVTPEAVRLDLPEATVGSRGAAVLVDWLLQLLIGLVVFFGSAFFFDVPGVPEWVPGSVAVILPFLLLFGYPITFETVWRGRTPGKALMGLRVVTIEGAPISFRHAVIRSGLGLIDFFATFGLAAVVSSLVSRHHQRLGDFVAGTVVLRERTGAPQSGALTFQVPAAAAPLADGIDTSGLTHRDYSAVRSYLLRAEALRPPRREDVARQLLTAITPRLGTLPPNDLPPELLLRAVAARYQQRNREQRDFA